MAVPYGYSGSSPQHKSPSAFSSSMSALVFFKFATVNPFGLLADALREQVEHVGSGVAATGWGLAQVLGRLAGHVHLLLLGCRLLRLRALLADDGNVFVRHDQIRVDTQHVAVRVGPLVGIELVEYIRLERGDLPQVADKAIDAVCGHRALGLRQ